MLPIQLKVISTFCIFPSLCLSFLYYHRLHLYPKLTAGMFMPQLCGLSQGIMGNKKTGADADVHVSGWRKVQVSNYNTLNNNSKYIKHHKLTVSGQNSVEYMSVVLLCLCDGDSHGWRCYLFHYSVHASVCHFHSHERDMSGTAWGNVFRFSTNV